MHPRILTLVQHKPIEIVKKHNVGKTDQIIPIVLGLFLLGLGILLGSWWGVVGLIPLLTGLAPKCAIYTLFG